MPPMRSHAARLAAMLALLALLVGACGSPTDEGADAPEAGEAGNGATAEEPGSNAEGIGDEQAPESDCPQGGVDGVLAEVDGLDGDERAERLAELAQEAGAVSLYTSLTNDLVEAVTTAFTEQYGVDLQVYRASGEDITQRLLQEVTAGRPGADVVESGGVEMVVYTNEGALAAYESPAREGLIEDAVLDEHWTGTRVQVFTPAWNTELVTDPPTSWEDLGDPRWDGRMAMETGNADWYMALSEYWLEQGRSEEEVQQLWSDIADGTFMVSGHSTMRELMVGGEFGAAATLYRFMTQESMADGAPLEWKPGVSPLFIRTQGAGIVDCSPNPAGAVLLIDWLLSADGGQQAFVDGNIDPVREDLLDLGDSEVRAIDVEQFTEEQERWEDEFERLTGLGQPAG